MKTVVVAVASKDLKDVEDALKAITGETCYPSFSLGVRIELSSVAGSAEYAANYLEDHGLTDQNQAWSDYDSRNFGVDITLAADVGSLGDRVLGSTAMGIGELLSKRLEVMCIVSGLGGEEAWAAFDSGRLAKDYQNLSP